jgi:hypothetical protein
MSLQSILSQYLGTPGGDTPDATQHFDAAAQQLPAQSVGQGLADAFRSDQTPTFGQMMGQLFGQSNQQQRAGMLNELIAALGPSAAALGGGVLSRVLGSGGAGTGSAPVTPTQASQLTPDEVSQIAAHAERQDPSIVDRLGNYYAQHPQLVKTLGSAVLAVALAKIANRVRA